MGEGGAWRCSLDLEKKHAAETKKVGGMEPAAHGLRIGTSDRRPLGQLEPWEMGGGENGDAVWIRVKERRRAQKGRGDGTSGAWTLVPSPSPVFLSRRRTFHPSLNSISMLTHPNTPMVPIVLSGLGPKVPILSQGAAGPPCLFGLVGMLFTRFQTASPRPPILPGL